MRFYKCSECARACMLLVEGRVGIEARSHRCPVDQAELAQWEEQE